ncbi:MAG: phytanoyl-CoA dioxygenase family protein [Planctomycetota bacterium]|nr:phytanoyl-CoA dioxygenase family protein [Planctomycetota bacterium]
MQPHDDTWHHVFLEPTLGNAERLSYQEQGFLNLGPLLTPLGLERMRSECMATWSATKTGFDPKGSWLQNALLPNIHHHSELVRRYYFDGPLVDVATQLIGPDIKAATSQLTFKLRGNTQSFGWHQDNGYGELDPYNSISCLTTLDDTDQDNGCLWVIPGSHQRGQAAYRHTLDDKNNQVSIDMEVNADHAIPIPLQAAHCLILNCHLLHMSQGNSATDRDRRILFTRYADADAVEVYNHRQPRLGRLLRGVSRFPEVDRYESDLETPWRDP